MALLGLLLTLGLLAMADVAARQGSGGAQKCAAAKRMLAGKRIADLMTCDAKAVAKGRSLDLSCVSKAKDEFGRGWSNAETRGDCATTDDQMAIEHAVDALAADLQSRLKISDLASNCAAAKFKGAGSKGACKLRCTARAARKRQLLTDPRVVTCLSRCSDKFSAAYRRDEARGDCFVTGDAPAIELAIDAFVDDVTSELPEMPTTSTTTTSTTATTVTTAAPASTSTSTSSTTRPSRTTTSTMATSTSSSSTTSSSTSTSTSSTTTLPHCGGVLGMCHGSCPMGLTCRGFVECACR